MDIVYIYIYLEYIYFKHLVLLFNISYYILYISEFSWVKYFKIQKKLSKYTQKVKQQREE